jgi:hypothetical protein
MLNTKLKLTLGLAALAATTALAQTQTNVPADATSVPSAGAPAATPAAATPAASATTTTPSPNAFDQWVKDTKNLMVPITWGADARLRNEYVNNALTLSDGGARHEQDYFRFRERIWASAMPVTNVSVNTRLAAEEREWMKPANAGQYGYRSGFEERYGILDNANLKLNNILDQPLSITAGRQDIALGDPDDWWLVLDGTPGDGSWTFFLDSIRTTYELKEAKTKVDVIYIYQNALPDEWIPTIGESSDNTSPLGKRPYYLTEQNEQGVILYLSNKSIKNAQIDGYFIYKRDSRTDTSLISNGDNADIYTIGSKITGTPADYLSYSVEGAYQFGGKQDPMVGAAYVNSTTAWRDISAYAGKVRVNYLFNDQMKNQVSLVGEFLSGDDPNTKGRDEMFDVLWGRYPRWTELGTWCYAVETGGKYLQMNNLGRVGLNWNVTPVKGLNFNAMYNALFAPESIPTRDITGTSPANPERFSKNGNFRGHYVQGILKYQLNKYATAQVKGELLWEGDYYAQRDLMAFLRTELTFTF